MAKGAAHPADISLCVSAPAGGLRATREREATGGPQAAGRRASFPRVCWASLYTHPGIDVHDTGARSGARRPGGRPAELTRGGELGAWARAPQGTVGAKKVTARGHASRRVGRRAPVRRVPGGSYGFVGEVPAGPHSRLREAPGVTGKAPAGAARGGAAPPHPPNKACVKRSRAAAAGECGLRGAPPFARAPKRARRPHAGAATDAFSAAGAQGGPCVPVEVKAGCRCMLGALAGRRSAGAGGSAQGGRQRPCKNGTAAGRPRTARGQRKPLRPEAQKPPCGAGAPHDASQVLGRGGGQGLRRARREEADGGPWEHAQRRRGFETRQQPGLVGGGAVWWEGGLSSLVLPQQARGPAKSDSWTAAGAGDCDALGRRRRRRQPEACEVGAKMLAGCSNAAMLRGTGDEGPLSHVSRGAREGAAPRGIGGGLLATHAAMAAGRQSPARVRCSKARWGRPSHPFWHRCAHGVQRWM
jgi:hypothetical protein